MLKAVVISRRAAHNLLPPPQQRAHRLLAHRPAFQTLHCAVRAPGAPLPCRHTSLAVQHQAGAGRLMAPTEGAPGDAQGMLNSQHSNATAPSTPRPASVPICVQGAAVLAGEWPILTGLSQQSFVAEGHSSHGQLVLGTQQPKDEGAVSSAVVALGELVGDAFLCCARNKLCWMVPEHAISVAALPPEMQFLLARTSADGPYILLLPLISGGTFRCTLQPASKQSKAGNTLSIRMDSGNEDVKGSRWETALYLASGWDPYELIEQSVVAAARISGTALPLKEKLLPDSVNWFGWCTWDAFYHNVSAAGIQQGLAALHADGNGVTPRFLIIDDGWQRTDVDESLRRYAQDAAPAAAKDSNQVALEDEATQHEAAQRAAVLAAAIAQEGGTLSHSGSGGVMGVLGTLLGWTQASLLTFCRVAGLEPGKLIGRMLSRSAGALVKRSLMRYYAATSEHCKRLIAPECNNKFRFPDSGPNYSFNSGPGDLGAVIADLKARYGLRYIYTWHGVIGYWSGVAVPAAAGWGNATSHAAPEKGSNTAAHLQAGSAVAGSNGSSTGAAGKGDSNVAASSGEGWGGALSSRLVMPRMSDAQLQLEPALAWSQAVLSGIGAPKEPAELYKRLHMYLAAAGVDGVKVDTQQVLELVGSGAGEPGAPATAAAYHDALEDSVARSFPGNHLINCMCHCSEDLYHMRATALARCSDDFWPREAASHTVHVAACAYNSLFMSPLVQPDWDMFHSKHPAAVLHATARMISAGPIYVSDAPGRHDFDLLRRLVLPDGSVLRPLQPGLPTRDSLMADVVKDGESMLKVFNRNAFGGVVAAFNVQGSTWDRRQQQFSTHNKAPGALTSHICPSDVEHITDISAAILSSPSHSSNSNGSNDGINGSSGVARAAGTYAMYRDGMPTLEVLPLHSALQLTLGSAQSDVVTVAPVFEVERGSGGGKVAFAAVGLADMLNPGGAITRYTFGGAAGHSVAANGRPADAAAADVHLGVRGHGTLLLYASQPPSRCWLDGQQLPFKFSSVDGSMTVRLPAAGEGLAPEREVAVSL